MPAIVRFAADVPATVFQATSTVIELTYTGYEPATGHAFTISARVSVQGVTR
jgi:hypothetical protein